MGTESASSSPLMIALGGDLLQPFHRRREPPPAWGAVQKLQRFQPLWCFIVKIKRVIEG